MELSRPDGSTIIAVSSRVLVTSCQIFMTGGPSPRGAAERVAGLGAGVSSGRPRSPGTHMPWMSGWPSAVLGKFHDSVLVSAWGGDDEGSCAKTEPVAIHSVATIRGKRGDSYVQSACHAVSPFGITWTIRDAAQER